MNQSLQKILNLVEQSETLSAEQKKTIIDSIKETDKAIAITEFKLDRTEKVKRTTAILLEETIAELELKRKAVEEQNHELEIEGALERVRSVAMGMKKREDMLEVCKTIAQQLELLHVKEIRNVQTAIFYDEKGFYTNYEYYSKHDKLIVTDTEFRNHPVAEKFANQMMKGPNEVFIHGFTGEEVKDWLEYQKGTNVFIDSYLETAFSLTYYWYSLGPVALGISTYVPLKEEEIELFKRFRNVFELAYRRYLDIEKAEVQAREAQIQLALERVRARTMAMQKSDELSEAVFVLFQQFKELGENPDQATIGVINEKEHVIEYWVTMYGNQMNKVFKFSIDEPHVTNKIYNAWKEGKKSLVIDLSGKDLLEFMTYRAGKGGAAVNPNEKRRIINVAFFSKGLLIVQSTEEHSEESIKLLERFAAVFEQTYTRFLDLQKAETQARESEIELALERVRARTMAMQKSEELKEVINVVYDQLVHLNILVEHAGFIIDYKERDDLHLWIADQHLAPSEVTIPFFDCPPNNSIKEAKDKGQDTFTYHLSFEEKNKFYRDLFKLVPGVPDETLEYYLNCPGLAGSGVLLDNIGLYIENFSGTPYSEEDNAVLMRFGKVFQQTYTRFLDLQKAEEQAREATIEAALERVRAKALAMHKTEDLNPAVAVVFEELKKLNIGVMRCGLSVLNKEKRTGDIWVTSLNDKGSVVHVTGSEQPFDRHPLLQGAFDAWLRQEDFSYVLEGNDLVNYYNPAKPGDLHLPESQKKGSIADDFSRQYCYTAMYQAGGLFAFHETEFSDEAKKVMRRFANVFDLTYKRFLDLQKAEAQAREAKIEAALEKVRSRTLAMQKSDELAETAAVLFQQLILLGIEPNRLYISIIQNDAGDSEFWITDEDGSKVSTAYTANLNDNFSFRKMLDGWKEQKKSLMIDMHGKELEDYFNHLNSLSVPFKGGLSQTRRVQYIAYFSKGFIGMASPDEQPGETMQLLERFAAVFNLTFTRFNDLKVAEAHALQAEQDLIEIKAARKKAEDALTELQATQKQLVQSEKMASLGELTAGIAHEIQNPLNFVNNFSDVSNELLEEMKEELAKGNVKDAIAIAEDVKQNLEKINHHGKRADGIVKGMLQHSRTSSGQKELTDINALADEYLRLAFHGLRAKDKSFNAKFETDFDPAIEKINIVPQEIGRVILNLINNAFYAVSEKAKRNIEGYEPTVTVNTNKINNKITISVKDNGSGIPESIKEKIFQPFFTTKPTGQGTGLGLSLSYDIITKGHGGELKVETKEGEGSTFIIQLPANSVA